MTEQHPLRHSTDSLHCRRRKRALPTPEHPCGFSLCFALPSGHNKSTLRAFITQSLSCDSSTRDTGVEYGHSTSEESPTNDLLHLTFVFVFCFDCPRRALLPHTMDEILQRLTEVSIRQHLVVHLATREGETEQGLAELRTAAAQRVPLPDPRVQAAKLLPKMTPHDDMEAYLQMFETTATSEGWHPDDWARALAPLLTGEAQRAYFALPAASASQYVEVKKEILARLGRSPICAAQYFHEWEYKPRLPARAQAAELMRLAQHWLMEGSLSASQVAETGGGRSFSPSPSPFSPPDGWNEEPNHYLGAHGGDRAGRCSPTAGCRGASAGISRRVVQERRRGRHPATTEQAGASLSVGRAHADVGSHGSRPDLAGRMHCAPRPTCWGARSGRED